MGPLGPFLPAIVAVVVSAVVVTVVVVVTRRRTKAITVTREQLLELAGRWAAPQELLMLPIPRPVRFTGQGIVVVIVASIFAGGIAVAGGFLYSQFAAEERVFDLLEREGVAGEATVVQKWTRSGKSTSYYVQYEYTADGRRLRRQASVGGGEYRALEKGAKAGMRYAPSDPCVSRLDTEKRTPPWTPFLPFAFFAIVIPALLFQPMRQRRLLQTGRPVAAMVARVAPVKGGKAVTYQFVDATGGITTGVSSVLASVAVAPGDAVTALHDAARPKQSTLYPPQLVKLAIPGR